LKLKDYENSRMYLYQALDLLSQDPNRKMKEKKIGIYQFLVQNYLTKGLTDP